MDFSQVVLLLFAALWYLILVASFPALIKSTWFKGKFCSAHLNLYVKHSIDIKRYNLINNITLPTFVYGFCLIPFLEG
mgnify:CR=1 FL=1|jgi:hypothetical protein